MLSDNTSLVRTVYSGEITADLLPRVRYRPVPVSITPAEVYSRDEQVTISGVPVRACARRQMAGIAAAPPGYIETLSTDLAVQCLQYGWPTQWVGVAWVDETGYVAGITKETYVPTPTADILERLGAARVVHAALGPVSRVGLELGRMAGPDGTEVAWGVEIRNSDLGLAACTIQALLYRFICKNGVIRATLTGRARWVHKGAQTWDDVCRAIDAGMERDDVEGWSRMLAATMYRVADPVALLAGHGVGPRIIPAILADDGPGSNPDTLWGIVNACSHFAQGRADAEEYEALAGRLLSA